MRPISVVITSLRPGPLELTIDSIATHSDLVEVVVVSPWPPKPRDFVKHVSVPSLTKGDPFEREKAGELSLSKKINMALTVASGKYIIFHNDDLHFRPGWAPALLEHMKKNEHKPHPYLACFHLAFQGGINQRYTMFGMLYANHGCISKQDLSIVGGCIYDERMRTELVDPDLSLRVWAAGGMVEICPKVVIDSDSYTKLNPNIPDELCTPYKVAWAIPDGEAFFNLWFWKYFWLFFWNYRTVSKKLTNEDNVLTKRTQKRGAFIVFLKPLLRLFLAKLLQNKEKIAVAKKHLSRIVNRRWITLDYELPYKREEILRKLP